MIRKVDPDQIEVVSSEGETLNASKILNTERSQTAFSGVQVFRGGPIFLLLLVPLLLLLIPIFILLFFFGRKTFQRVVVNRYVKN